MKYSKLVLFITFLLALPMGFAGSENPSYQAAAKASANLPILHEGRVKPINTFAQVHLLAFYGKRKTEELGATEWLLELLISPEKADNRQVFDIRNAAVSEALNLEFNKKHKYSFNEIWPEMRKSMDFLRKAYDKPKEDRDLVESQMLELYSNLSRYIEIGKSLTFLQKNFGLSSEKLASAFGIKAGEKESLLYFHKKKDVFASFLQQMRQKPKEELNSEDLEIVHLAQGLDKVRKQDPPVIFQVIPPENGSDSVEWETLWSLLDGREMDERQTRYVNMWEEIASVFTTGKNFDGTFEESKSSIYEGVSRVKFSMLNLEVWTNKTDLFYKSVAFYILSFLLIIISWAIWQGPLKRAAFYSMLVGLLLHSVGIIFRMLIMGRPPVTTLYESIIFVGFISVLACAIYELMRKNSLGTFSGASLGAMLHFVGFGYASDGDTMGMLVAVLDSNFWLATHVVTIAIGYGCAFVAGFVGHLYLFFRIFKPKGTERLKALTKNMYNTSLVALFFTLFGTILGGIWADQSWGRFWGWDPKENGALLIVLWFLILMHGRISGIIKENGFAFGLIINNIIVALAWFGVNLLNVGLHSYGFTESIAMNLVMFCGGEFILGLIAYSFARWKSVT